MNANHYISKLSPDPLDDTWCLISHSENIVSEQIGKLSALASKLNNASAVLLLNAAEVRVIRATIPGRSESQVKQAAPYVIEEDLANDVDDLAIDVSKPDHDGQRLVTVYELQSVEEFCRLPSDAGIVLSAAIPDASLIATSQQSLIAIQANGRVLYGYQNGLFAAVSYDVFPILLDRLIRDAKLTEVLITVTPEASQAADYNDSLKAHLLGKHAGLDLVVEETQDTVSRHIVSRIAAEIEHSYPIDLLPDSIRQLGSFGFSTTKSYLIAAGLAFVALLVHISFSWLDNQSKSAELVSLKAQQQEIFREAFPEIKRVVNAEVQAQQRLKELQQQGPPPAEFLGVLHASTAFLARNNSRDLQLTGFSYADGVLLLRTESSDMALLEKYRSELSGFLSAEVVNAESDDNRVRGSIRVRSN